MTSPSFEPTPAQRARWTNPTKRYIEWLERTLADTRAQLALAFAGPEDSNVLIRWHGIYPDRLLGTGTGITFRLPGADDYIEVQHSRHDPNVIEIQCNGGALHITPQSSNVARVRIGEY